MSRLVIALMSMMALAAIVFGGPAVATPLGPVHISIPHVMTPDLPRFNRFWEKPSPLTRSLKNRKLKRGASPLDAASDLHKAD
jgi:hypothetical protein